MYWGAYARARAFKKTAALKGRTREIVKQFGQEFPVRTLASVLGVSRMRIYVLKRVSEISFRKRKTMKDEKEMLREIESLVKQFPFYGYRKITAILRYKRGIEIGRKRVYRIMRENK